MHSNVTRKFKSSIFLGGPPNCIELHAVVDGLTLCRRKILMTNSIQSCDLSSKSSSETEAFASELLENLEKKVSSVLHEIYNHTIACYPSPKDLIHYH